MVKDKLKKCYLGTLFHLPHNNIYSFHHLSNTPKIDLSERKLDTKKFYSFIEKHGPYVSMRVLLNNERYNGVSTLTFDDGLEDVYTIAYKYLKKEEIPFTIFVLTDKIGQEGYITKEQFIEMIEDPLVTIGSHGKNHVHFGDSTYGTQYNEIIESKYNLRREYNLECKYIAYPFGSYNNITMDIVKKAGYSYGFAVKGRPLVKGNHKNPYLIPRLSIDNNTISIYNNS